MGPNSNPRLYESVGASLVPALDEEFERRNITAKTLIELDDLCDKKLNVTDYIVEPTMITRLYALSRVQNTQMGIHGFEPFESVGYGDAVEASAAPDHDSFEADGRSYHTRVVRLRSTNLESDISVFGLNFYRPDVDGLNPSDLLGEAPQETGPTLLVVSSEGEAKREKQVITGQTSVFAVLNRKTGDAKFYHVDFLSGEEADAARLKASGVLGTETPNDATQIDVSLPSGQYMRVRQLTGDLQNQVHGEFESGVSALQKEEDASDDLSAEERAAVHISQAVARKSILLDGPLG